MITAFTSTPRQWRSVYYKCCLCRLCFKCASSVGFWLAVNSFIVHQLENKQHVVCCFAAITCYQKWCPSPLLKSWLQAF